MFVNIQQVGRIYRRFHVLPDTKSLILEMLFPANLTASTEKIKTKARRKNII